MDRLSMMNRLGMMQRTDAIVGRKHTGPGTHRIDGMDMARAIAIFTMVAVNYASLMEVDFSHESWAGPFVDFLYGRAATLFVMLAGFSLSRWFGRHRPTGSCDGARRSLMIRCILLFTTGMGVSCWWEADILHVFALFLLLGGWFATWTDRRLKMATAAAILISFPVSAVLTATYETTDLIPYVEGQYRPVQLILEYLTSRYYSLFPWITFMGIGMLLGRMRHPARPLPERCLVISLLTCILVEWMASALSAWMEVDGWVPEVTWWYPFLRSDPFPVTPLFMVSSCASAFVVVSFCQIVFRSKMSAHLLRPVVYFGRMSLTMYVAHLAAGFVLLEWFESTWGMVTPLLYFATVGLFCFSGICFASWWLARFRRGPMETVFSAVARTAAVDSNALNTVPVVVHTPMDGKAGGDETRIF
jgi:uncharacterized membrane protein YeiB